MTLPSEQILLHVHVLHLVKGKIDIQELQNGVMHFGKLQSMMTRWTNFRRGGARLLWKGIASVSDNAEVQNCYSFRLPAGNILNYLEYPKHQQCSKATTALHSKIS